MLPLPLWGGRDHRSALRDPEEFPDVMDGFITVPPTRLPVISATACLPIALPAGGCLNDRTNALPNT